LKSKLKSLGAPEVGSIEFVLVDIVDTCSELLLIEFGMGVGDEYRPSEFKNMSGIITLSCDVSEIGTHLIHRGFSRCVSLCVLHLRLRRARGQSKPQT